MGWTDLTILAALTVFALSLSWVGRRSDTIEAKREAYEHPIARLVYVDGSLIDASTHAGEELNPATQTVLGLQGLIEGQFPTINLVDQEDLPSFSISQDGQSTMTIALLGQTMRIALFGSWDRIIKQPSDTKGLLEQIESHAPQLMWQQDDAGDIVWMNASYRQVLRDASLTDNMLFSIKDGQADDPVRLQPKGQTDSWFDVKAVNDGNKTLFFATETTALVKADEDRRDFVTTLGKTFADLATGLAIFDKDRQLKMFNPAFLEMSKLPFTFLSARPRIDTFLDRLRELQMMPEPKDYVSWREQFTAVETGALDGTFCENWALPDGQTFRVTGRPHPDGAFALLFEDISAELSLNRRFRTEIETGQAILDELPDAVAVFSNACTLVVSNAAYATLWGKGQIGLLHRDAENEVSTWRENTVTSPIWEEFRDLLRQNGTRKPWVGDTLLLDGRPLRCHATPLEGGMVLARFSFRPIVRPVIQKLTQNDPAIRTRHR